MAEKRMNPRKVPVKPAKQMKPSQSKRIIMWVIAIAVFYFLTAATVSTSVQEMQKQVEQRYTENVPQVVEQTVQTTQYRTEKTPYGEPRCEQMNYNFSFTYVYTEQANSNGKVGTCAFTVKNEEDIPGTFTFYAQVFHNGQVSDTPDQTHTIDAMSTTLYSWDINAGIADSVSCLLQANDPPHRAKCFYLEPITYQIKQVPYTVTETKNVTTYVPVNRSKVVTVLENETVRTYTNRYFGYPQFFYFGY